MNNIQFYHKAKDNYNEHKYSKNIHHLKYYMNVILESYDNQCGAQARLTDLTFPTRHYGR